jgi:hypothetical protein
MKRESLFEGYWRDMEGRRLRRIRRDEMADLWRMWAKHRDIREGQVRS